MKFSFFVKTPQKSNRNSVAIPVPYSVEVWKPKLYRIKPEELGWIPFSVWWAFHFFRVFKNRSYSIVTIRKDGKVVHRSCVFPKYFRFPFMSSEDIQVGDTWTAENERGRGLASLALNYIVKMYSGNRIWYLTEESNVASIRAAEKSGFCLCAKGIRTKKFGLNLLGAYSILSESVFMIASENR